MALIPKLQAPHLSIVLIHYNMARELPRTLTTLSPAYQLDVSATDYNVLCVDNASTMPARTAAFAERHTNFSFMTAEPHASSKSPARAINAGVNATASESIGLMIDGARMCSPGIVRLALDALRFGKGTVVGTIAYHLGDKVQMESVHDGYNQGVEDALLSTVDWQSDGYRLFDISVPAGSSAGGWFELPAETNAIFMHRELWDELGGVDERFEAPGGGLVNHDLWHRACEHPDTEVILLLGEATFHQFHGGVATNSTVHPWESYAAEYESIKNKQYKRLMANFRNYGSLPGHVFV